MIDPRPSLVLALVVPLMLPAPGYAGQGDPRQRGAPRGSVTMGSIIIQQRMIIRVPRLPVGRTPLPARASGTPLPPITWVEKRAGKCVAAIDLAGAAISRPDSVDLVLNGGRRLRARLASNCPALDFYDGFYVKPAGDGKICADRDSLRSRAGLSCQITSLRALVPGR